MLTSLSSPCCLLLINPSLPVSVSISVCVFVWLCVACSRGLKQLSLSALDALLQAPSSRGPPLALDAAICGAVLQESALVLSGEDTHSLFLNLRMLHSLLGNAELEAQAQQQVQVAMTLVRP